MLQSWQGTRLPASPKPDVSTHRFNCDAVSFSETAPPLSNISAPCLLIKLLCCEPDVAAAFRKENIIGSVLGLLMTFPTGLTAVSVKDTPVAPEEGQEMVEQLCSGPAENVTKHHV